MTRYAIQQDFSEDPPYSPPNTGFQPSQPVEPLSLGYGAPLADPLTVYTSPSQQTSSRRGKRQKGSRSSSSSRSSKGGRRSKKGGKRQRSSRGKKGGNVGKAKNGTGRQQERSGRKVTKHPWVPGT